MNIGDLRKIERKLGNIEESGNAIISVFSNFGAVIATFDRFRSVLDRLNNAKNAAQQSVDNVTQAQEKLAIAKRNVENATKRVKNSTKKMNDLNQKQIGAQNNLAAAQAKVITVKKTAAFAQKTLNMAMKAFPLLLIISLLTTLVSVGGRFVRWLQDTRAGATDCGKSIRDLADEFGRSTDDIRADMDAMGTDSLEVWYRQEQAVREFADAMGGNVDEIREQMQELGVGYDRLGAHMQTLESVGEQFGKTQREVAEALAAQGLPLDALISMTPELAEATAIAALEIARLSDAYDQAFGSAYSSIQSQMGLFGGISFAADEAFDEVENSAEAMAAAWEQQAADMERHSENLARAIELGLTESVIGAFTDINQAGNLQELINSFYEGVDEYGRGVGDIVDNSDAMVTRLNDAFAGAEMGRADLASAMALIEADFENGMAAVLQVYQDAVGEMGDISPECIEHGRAAIENLLEGMNSESPNIMRIVNELGDDLLSTLDEAVSAEETAAIATEAMVYFENAVEGRRNSILSTIRSIGSAFRREMDRSISSAQATSSSISTALNQSLNHGINLAVNAPDSGYQTSLLERIADGVEAGKNIIMATGELVGATYHGYDVAAGTAISYNKRWGR